MKVIDFACRFLAALQKEELTLPAHQVLLAVAAGYDTGAAVAAEMDIAQSACTRILRGLERDGFLLCICRTGEFYRLSAAGKAYLCRLLSFAQQPIHAQKTTPDH